MRTAASPRAPEIAPSIPPEPEQLQVDGAEPRFAQSTPTADISAFIAAVRPADFPADVQRHTLATFLNFVGCAAGGARHDAVERAMAALGGTDMAGGASLIGRAERTTPALAALLNGIAASINAFDDTHAQVLIHPGSPVGAALIGALGRVPTPLAGEDLLAAYACGVELACRAAKAIAFPPAATDLGWSLSGTCGALGAAAACAKALALPAAQIATAIGIAASAASGLRVAHGSMAMHLVPARAGAIGLEAALLARAGFTGPQAALEGRHGFLALFSSQAHRPYLADGWGRHFELLANAFKAYPCGTVIHSAIDACLELAAAGPIDERRIASVEIMLAPSGAALADRPHPASEFEVQVSAQHWAAAALLRGRAGIAEGRSEAIADPGIGALRERIHVHAAAAVSDEAAIVRLVLTDGSETRVQIDHCRGSLANPFDLDALSAKFLDQAIPVVGERESQRLLAACLGLPASGDARAGWGLAAEGL
jgi:2-methylcitrate dehydratase PrpD